MTEHRGRGRPPREGGPKLSTSIRVDKDVLDEVHDALPPKTSMGDLVSQFLEWWLRKPGAKMPKRPPAKTE